METWVIIVVFVVGILLAFPAAVLVAVAGGFIITVIGRLTTPCPECGQKKMRVVNDIRETYPTGRGTGTFYLCEVCSRRWFWSNDDKRFEDASASRYDHWYELAQKG